MCDTGGGYAFAFALAGGDGREACAAFVAGAYGDAGRGFRPFGYHKIWAACPGDSLSFGGADFCDRGFLSGDFEIYVRNLGHVCAEQQGEGGGWIFSGGGACFGGDAAFGDLENGGGTGGEKKQAVKSRAAGCFCDGVKGKEWVIRWSILLRLRM